MENVDSECEYQATNLKEGDIFKWNIEPRKNKLIIVVTVQKEEPND